MKKIPPIGIGTIDVFYDVKLNNSSNRFIRSLQARYYTHIYRRYLNLKFVLNLCFAIKRGYRLIDTSTSYHNENLIKWAIKISQVKRDDICITTRVSNQGQFQNKVRESLEKSLKNLGTDYIDIYMFHWPVTEHYLGTWKVLEELYAEGKVKVIGVANCHIHHLEAIFKIAKIKPMINQFELHPLMTQTKLVDFCRKNDIRIEAYTPIARNNKLLIESETISFLSDKYKKTPQQIVLRWHTQKGYIPIPRSSKRKRTLQNISIFDFELLSEEIEQVDNLNQDLRLRFDPDNCDFKRL